LLPHEHVAEPQIAAICDYFGLPARQIEILSPGHAQARSPILVQESGGTALGRQASITSSVSFVWSGARLVGPNGTVSLLDGRALRPR
jgi:hypothetical protein